MFSAEAQDQLGYYIYALFDPAKPNWPFYIGKGTGNRVFMHAMGELPEEGFVQEPMSPKAKLISDIGQRGDKVIQKVIRFGLSEEEALSVEAALIDMLNLIEPDLLSNQISGQGVAEGIIDAIDLATALSAKPLHSDLPILLIKIERRWSRLMATHEAAHQIAPSEIYDSVRGNWKLSVQRANKAQCVLAVARGLVRGAFVVNKKWFDSIETGRKCFDGVEAPDPFKSFIGQSVTAYFKKGSQNPIRYLNC